MSGEEKESKRKPKQKSQSTTKVSRRAALKTLGAASLIAAGNKSSNAEPANRAQRRQTGMTAIKQQAVADWQTSMQQFGGSLSHPIENLIYAPNDKQPWQFDVAVIGSGYGASICAARLAGRMRPGKRLCVIERGKEWTPGTFGDTLKEVREESRFELLGKKRRTVTNPLGLVNMVQNNEVNVLSASGLGGTSLLNANVALRPDPDVFNITQWPAELRDRVTLDPYYDLAATELGITTAPFDGSPKMRAQRLASVNLMQLGGHWEAADVAVTFDNTLLDAENRNKFGIIQRACKGCGDCTSGCNVGAKNTLQTNYLPLARTNGAEIYTRTEVVSIRKKANYYQIYLKHYKPCATGHEPVYAMITSRIVVLGAGSLGSTEILLRSWAAGIEFSKTLGWNWTGNGDALGFVLKSNYQTNVGGVGAFPNEGDPIGPTIQTNLTFPERPNFRDRVLIQDGAIARAYANTAGALMQDLDLQSTMVMLGMGHDGANGRIVLRDGGVAEVKWPGITEGEYRKYIRAHFEQVANAHGGKYKYLKLYGDNFVSVHPLGGCNMSDDPDYGVTNHKGQVYDGVAGSVSAVDDRGAPIHDGLYVSDGAIVPYSLAANPYFTIAALSERVAHLMMCEPKYADLFA